MILIDDCSTDDSGAICREYCRLDQRFLYLKNEANIGTAASRNVGIKAARGTYITFFDNDDWCDDPFAFEKLSSQVKDDCFPDVVCYETKNYWGRSETLEEPKKIARHAEICNCNSFEERVEYLLKNGVYYSAVWSKTVKRAFIESFGILFPEGRRNEDTAWSLKLLYYANSITWLDSTYYVWRRNSSGSQSSGDISFSEFRDITLIIQAHLSCSQNRDIARNRWLLASHFVAYIYIIALSYINLVAPEKQDEAEYEAICDFLFEQSPLLNFHWNTKVNLIRRVTGVIGIRRTAYILSLAMRSEKVMIRCR